MFVLIKKEKKKGETEKELIGNLSYIKCIASLSVELSSCYLAYIGMGQDKIPLPHQVRSIIVSWPTVQAWPGVWIGCPTVELEQSSASPSVLLWSFFTRHQHEWRGPNQTLDHNMNACKLHMYNPPKNVKMFWVGVISHLAGWVKIKYLHLIRWETTSRPLQDCEPVLH